MFHRAGLNFDNCADYLSARADGILDWKTEVHYWYEIMAYQSYSSYRAEWYSPQPTYNGKLVVIWNDGSTVTFSVGLKPSLIEKFSDEGSSDGEVSYGSVQNIYWWNNTDPETGDGEWVYDRTEEGSDSNSGSGVYTSSSLSIQFSAKIKSKGSPLIQGTLSLEDDKYVSDSFEHGSITVSASIGPYDISCYSWTP